MNKSNCYLRILSFKWPKHLHAHILWQKVDHLVHLLLVYIPHRHGKIPIVGPASPKVVSALQVGHAVMDKVPYGEHAVASFLPRPSPARKDDVPGRDAVGCRAHCVDKGVAVNQSARPSVHQAHIARNTVVFAPCPLLLGTHPVARDEQVVGLEEANLVVKQVEV